MTTFLVPDMSCGHCTASIEASLRKLDPAADVRCDLARHTVAVDSTRPPEALLSAIREAGYEASLRG